MDEQTINALAAEIYNHNKSVGGWDDNRSIKTALMLVITEIAEATEGERKDLMDDHLPHRKAGEVGLADALIGMLDIGGKSGFCYEKQVWLKLVYKNIYEAHLTLCDIAISIFTKKTANYSNFIDAIFIISEHFGYDVESAMDEKLAFNKTRPDHKRENRAKKGGKRCE